MNAIRGVLAAIAIACLASTARAQTPGWSNIPDGQWFTIPGTSIRVFEDGGRLKYWVENLPGGGKLVHFRDFENDTKATIEDTVSGDSDDDNVDIDVEEDNTEVTVDECHFADVTVSSGSDNATVTLVDTDNSSVDVAGDNGDQNLEGDSFNNTGHYEASASGNSHANNGTGGGNVFTDASNNSGAW